MMRGLAIEGGLARRLKKELVIGDREQGAFCLLRRVAVGSHERYVLSTPIELPPEWFSSSLGHFSPSGRAISAAISAAQQMDMGLALIHTHPSTRGPAHLSTLDLNTSRRLAVAMKELVDGPFMSLVLTPTGWAGVVGDGGEPVVPLDRIWIVEGGLAIHVGEALNRRVEPLDDDIDDRQALVLGEAAETLRNLCVAVVGAGGVGSPVAETLARIGVRLIRLIDHDFLDTPSNARRVFGTTRRDVVRRPPAAKAQVVAEALNRLELGTEVEPVVGDVRDPEILGLLLEADVVICATDSHSSRASIARTCVEAMIPLIDVGARVGRRQSGALDALLFERRIQLPGGPCLWCWKVIDPERIRYELLPAAERDRLVEEGYVTGIPIGPEPSIAALTVTAAGAACAALVGLVAHALNEERLAASAELLSMESYAMRSTRDPGCICSRWRTRIGPHQDDIA
jgi:ThiF family protein